MLKHTSISFYFISSKKMSRGIFKSAYYRIPIFSLPHGLTSVGKNNTTHENLKRNQYA